MVERMKREKLYIQDIRLIDLLIVLYEGVMGERIKDDFWVLSLYSQIDVGDLNINIECKSKSRFGSWSLEERWMDLLYFIVYI